MPPSTNRRSQPAAEALAPLLARIDGCTHCASHLPEPPRPILQAHQQARVLIVGQAPGRQAHERGRPFDDASGERLRAWLGVSREAFYDSRQLAIMPVGFCYPGKRGGGDAPPRPECAPLWHDHLLAAMPHISLTVLLGAYAQRAYLGVAARGGVTATVAGWREHAPECFPLPHPSPRNNGWMATHPWFAAEVLPALQAAVATALGRGTAAEHPTAGATLGSDSDA